HGPKVPDELEPFLLVRNLRSRSLREFQTCIPEPGLSGDREGPREGLVRVGERKVADPAVFADLEGTLGMVQRGLRSTEQRVDVGDLPLADRRLLRFLRPRSSGTARRAPCGS